MRLRSYVLVVPSVVGSIVAGGLSWFFGGAMKSAAPFCAASAGAGALVGALLSIGVAKGVSRELASLREEASSLRQKASERLKERPAVQDVREVRELVTSLTRVLRTAEEVEASRNAALEKAVEAASAALNEAARHMGRANQKVAEAAKVLAAVEGGPKHAAASGD